MSQRLSPLPAVAKDRKVARTNAVAQPRDTQDPESAAMPAGAAGAAVADEGVENQSGGDFLGEGRVVSHPQPANRAALQEQTRRALATLTQREEQVLRMRFGIGERWCQTIEEIGRALSVGLKRIRQIEANALRKLRYPQKTAFNGAKIGELRTRAHSSGGQSRRLITGRSQVRVLVGPPSRGPKSVN